MIKNIQNIASNFIRVIPLSSIYAFLKNTVPVKSTGKVSAL